ncbi:MAG: flagellar motor protein MotB [bacterium]|nr:flagellar motor protein MotB [bacterium]
MGLDPSEAEDHVCEEGAPAWLATMGDLMSLLLTFFVLMLSFANMDRQLFLEAMGSIQGALGFRDEEPGQFKTSSSSVVEMSDTKSTPFLDIMNMPTKNQSPSADQAMMQQVEQSIAENNLARIIEAESSERGIIVRVKGRALFEPGSDVLLPESFMFLDEIVRLTEEFPYDLSIEGHTDASPISTQRFPSNWHLSAARAIAVLQYMNESGGLSPEQLSAAGFAHTRPLVEGDTQESREKNRRVEFVFLRDPEKLRESRSRRKAREGAEARAVDDAEMTPVEQSPLPPLFPVDAS